MLTSFLSMRTCIVLGIFSLARSAKILTFDNRREENTSSKLLNGKTVTSKDLTLCVDFKVDRVSDIKILTTGASEDLEIQIPPTLDRFYVEVKGIFYLAPIRQLYYFNSKFICLLRMGVVILSL